MRLIGKLDSPYVRRVAISLDLLGHGFEHHDLSVFSDYEAFEAINPIVKAPTLVTDDGTVLLDSTLILEAIERPLAADRRLAPTELQDFLRHQRIVGLALAACEKTVQIAYEHRLRPEEKRYEPWIDRVGTQLDHAYRLLEAELDNTIPWLFGSRPLQADITAAVAWRFSRDMLPIRVTAEKYPRLAALSAEAEALPAFLAYAP